MYTLDENFQEEDWRSLSLFSWRMSTDQQMAVWNNLVDRTVDACFETCVSKVTKELTNEQIDCATKCSERFYETFAAVAESMSRI